MQFRIYDRQTLAYKDGGYVASYTIDDDYIVNNNSTINIIKELNNKVVVGDTIVLIKTSGAYHKGTITTFDNADFKITYKADKELFNDNMLNPYSSFFADESNKEVTVAKRFGIEDVANIIESYFGKANDWLRQLPIKLVTDGDVLDLGFSLKLVEREKEQKTLSISSFSKSTFKEKFGDVDNPVVYIYNNNSWNFGKSAIDLKDYGITLIGEAIEGDTLTVSLVPSMLWTWKNDTINVVDWLVELFTSYNLSLSWTIDFNIAETDLSKRKPYYIVTLSAVTNGGKIIKDNVEMQTITYTEKKLPEATVCVVLDSESKTIYQMNSNKNLLNPYYVEEDKFLTVGYGMEQTQKDETSNVSGFIKLNIDNKDEKDGVKVTYYTLSCNNYDGKPRNIILYDKSKKIISFKENGETKSFLTYNTIPYSFYTNDTNIAYCKVCYDNRATEVQLEKGKGATAYDGFNIPAIYYLCEREGNYYVSLNPEEGMTVTDEVTGEKRYLSLRVMPSKMVTATFDTSSESEKETTPQEVAEKTLIPSKFNQAIEIQISADSKMFDFENSQFGDLYKIINEYGTIDSNYTGRKEDSSNKWINLYFGLGRQNYTDLIQMRMRKNKYEVVYKK